jgi:glucose-1-phosphatase
MCAEPVEALLFDLGGVVITIDFGRCFHRWADSAGCAPDDIAARFVFDSAYEEHERGTLDTAAYWTNLRNALSLDLSDGSLLAGWNDIYLGADLEVLDLLSLARAEWPLYAFTNSNPAHQTVWAARFSSELNAFDTIFVSSELGHRKPDRAAFDMVVTSIGVPASRILFFDDSVENVVGAQEAGLQAVHVTSTESVRSGLRSADLRY